MPFNSAHKLASLNDSAPEAIAVKHKASTLPSFIKSKVETPPREVYLWHYSELVGGSGLSPCSNKVLQLYRRFYRNPLDDGALIES